MARQVTYVTPVRQGLLSYQLGYFNEQELPWLKLEFNMLSSGSIEVGGFLVWLFEHLHQATRDAGTLHLSSLSSLCWLQPKAGPRMAAAVPGITSKFIFSHWLGLYHMTILQPMPGGFP